MVVNTLFMSTKLLIYVPNTNTYQYFIDYNRVYQAFITSGHKHMDGHDSSLIDLTTFASLYSIFYFDLTCQEEDLYKSVKYAEMEVRWSNQAMSVAPNGYYLWTIYESERVLKFRGIQGSMAVEL